MSGEAQIQTEDGEYAIARRAGQDYSVIRVKDAVKVGEFLVAPNEHGELTAWVHAMSDTGATHELIAKIARYAIATGLPK